jgi:hypothetical protein
MSGPSPGHIGSGARMTVANRLAELSLTVLWCPECGDERGFEQPPCVDGHGGDCPERACVDCGFAVVLATAPLADADADAGDGDDLAEPVDPSAEIDPTAPARPAGRRGGPRHAQRRPPVRQPRPVG